MTVIFDLADGLTRALRDRAQAWDFIRDFAAYWGRPLRPGDGWSEGDLSRAERRLGLRLPAALREAHLLFGRRTDLTSNHDTFLPPAELYVADGALVHRVENQGCAYWGIALSELEAADPGTVIRLDLADRASERWEPWEAGFSAACVAMVMSETLLQEDGLTDHGELEDDMAALGGLFRELPAVGRELRWFAGQEALIRVVEDTVVDVRARSEAALDAVRQALPVDWLNG